MIRQLLWRVKLWYWRERADWPSLPSPFCMLGLHDAVQGWETTRRGKYRLGLLCGRRRCHVWLKTTHKGVGYNAFAGMLYAAVKANGRKR